ncbi:MAG: antioxidant, AhpC/TSA family [Elusimicrobia bacterium]|nr:MAG: antioxidant, AhpC/TSA family [Elusimicrobiota bacterium]
MALMESVPVALGTEMPDLRLSDPAGKEFEGRALYGPKGLVVAFTCNHCPYAIAVWPRLVRLAAKAQALGVGTVAVNPNIHPGYPDDAPKKMTEKIREWGIPFPYLVDETQGTAKAFKAQCTPDLYLYGADRRLSYHGRLDDNWQDEAAVRREELWEAVESVAAGRPVAAPQRPSMGCSIKWR